MNHRMLITILGCLLVLAGGLAVFTVTSTAQEKAKRPKEKSQPAGDSKVAEFMRKKLEGANDVLEGLVTENFGLIKKGAETMAVMSQAAQWQVIEGPVYAQSSAQFRHSADQIIKMAEAKNLDGAGLAYVQLTLNCMSCHKHVRGVKTARGETLPLGFEMADLSNLSGRKAE